MSSDVSMFMCYWATTASTKVCCICFSTSTVGPITHKHTASQPYVTLLKGKDLIVLQKDRSRTIWEATDPYHKRTTK